MADDSSRKIAEPPEPTAPQQVGPAVDPPLVQPEEGAASSLPASNNQRRLSGGRHGSSVRVTVYRGEEELVGWALNTSRGGIRMVLEESIGVGMIVDVRVEDEPLRSARVVWVRNEADGQIVGLEFVETPGGGGEL